MKKLIFLTITLALLGGGYYYYNQNSDQVSTTSYEYLNIEKGDIKKPVWGYDSMALSALYSFFYDFLFFNYCFLYTYWAIYFWNMELFYVFINHAYYYHGLFLSYDYSRMDWCTTCHWRLYKAGTIEVEY